MGRSSVLSTDALGIAALIGILLFSILVPAVGIGTKDGGPGTRDMAAIYWPNIGRDHSHRGEGSPGSRGIADPVVKWDQSENSTSPATVAADISGNVVFDGVPKFRVVGVLSSNTTHVQVRDGDDGSLVWTVDARDVTSIGRLLSSASYMDTDDDGRLEIAVPITNGTRYVLVLFEPSVRYDKDGYHYDDMASVNDRVWTTSERSGTVTFSSPVPYDVSSDGTEDVIMGAGNYLVCHDGRNGSLVWQREIGPASEILSPASVIGTGPLARIVVNSLNNLNELRTTIVNFNGLHLNNVTQQLNTIAGQVTMPVIGDVTGDGSPEIVVTYPSIAVPSIPRIKVFDLSLEQIASASNIISGSLESSCAMSDIDGDGTMEILLSTRIISTNIIRMYCLKVTLSGPDLSVGVLWSRDASTMAAPIYSPPVVCDLDEDEERDVVYFGGGRVYCIRGSGSFLWNLSVGDHIFQGAGTVGDLGKDDFSDISIDGITISQRIVDLFVARPWNSSMVISDPEPVEGSDVTISCIISNIGNSFASNVMVLYSDDGEPIGHQLLTQVVQTRESTMTWRPLSDGVHRITVTIDPDDNITELDETNNEAFIDVAVSSSFPDMNVSGISYYRADGAEADGTTRNLVDEDPSKIVAEISNLGFRRSGPFKVTLFIDDYPISEADVNDIIGNGKRNVTFEWTPDIPDGGTVSVLIYADLDDSVPEVSEENNGMAEVIRVKSKQPIATQSYIVTGTVTDPGSQEVSGARVVLENNRTGELLVDNTTLQGIYSMNAALLPSGYLDGDQMTVRASMGSMWGRAYLRAYSQDGLKDIDIRMTDVPTLSLELQAIGSRDLTVDPGKEVSTPVKAVNTGNIQGQVSISLLLESTGTNDTSSGWITNSEPYSFILPPDGSQDVTVSVIVPDDARPAESVSLKVSGLMNGTELSFLTYTLTVGSLAELLVEMNSPTDIVLDPNIGTEARMIVYVENIGNVPCDSTLTMTGEIGEDTVIDTGTIDLEPGEAKEIVATISMDPSDEGEMTGVLRLTSSASEQLFEWDVTVEVVLPNVAVTSDITAEPPGRVLGEEVKLSVEITNDGRVDLRDLDYEFRANGVSLGRLDVKDLQMDKSVVLVGYWTPSTSGRHTIQFTVDPDDAVMESDEGDNNRSRSFEFHPDLLIRSVVLSELRPSEGETIKATIEVENKGGAPSNSLRITVRFDSPSAEPLSSSDLNVAIESGSVRTETIEFALPYESGEHTLIFHVAPISGTDQDPTNNVWNEEIAIKEISTGSIWPFILGGAALLLLLLIVGAFLMFKFGIIAREEAGDGPEEGADELDISELLEEPVMEMDLEPTPDDMTEATEPMDVPLEEVVVADIVEPVEDRDPDEAMIPEV